MKILSITAQKPNSTGSGVYLTELVHAFAAKKNQQAVIAGIYKEDQVVLPERTEFYPVYFHSQELPFAIPGMSDEMPYESTIYAQMTKEMTQQFETVFLKRIKEVCAAFQPDVIVCHHLYLLTACVRNAVKDCKVIGICHGTGLRQIKKIDLKNEFIKKQIQNLDFVFALQEDQKKEIMKIYEVPEERIQVIGVGYNNHIFYPPLKEKQKPPVRLVFAGKLSEKKGVMSLLRCVRSIEKRQELELILCGGYGNIKEYEEIKGLAMESGVHVELMGKLSQAELAEVFRSSHIFVLPSFYEGLPLVLLEALACDMHVICTALPGIKEWLDEKLPGHGVCFVEPPQMKNTDEPIAESLPSFEQRLADQIRLCVGTSVKSQKNIDFLSWEGIGSKILDGIEKIYK